MNLKKRLTVGDWAVVSGKSYWGYVGFVLQFDRLNAKYAIQLTSTPQGKPAQGVMWIPAEKVYFLEEEPEEYNKQNLVDLALDTNDKKWFKQLTTKKKIERRAYCEVGIL